MGASAYMRPSERSLRLLPRTNAAANNVPTLVARYTSHETVVSAESRSVNGAAVGANQKQKCHAKKRREAYERTHFLQARCGGVADSKRQW